MLSRLSAKEYFLIDGIGAIVTGFMLSVTLVIFETYIGMPRQVLYSLAAVAGLFATYSFLCYFFLKDRFGAFLKIIAVANTIYCVVTLCLVFILNDDLTILGSIYFIGEIVIVMSLVRWEWSKSNTVG